MIGIFETVIGVPAAWVFGEVVRAGRASILDIADYKQAFERTMDSYIAFLEDRDLSDHLEGAVNDISEPVDGFGYYPETLYTAVGSTAVVRRVLGERWSQRRRRWWSSR